MKYEFRSSRVRLAYSVKSAMLDFSVVKIGRGTMAAGNFEACLKFVLQFEGGFVNNPADPGGPTNLGVTQTTLSAFLGRHATVDEVKALTPEKVAPIYRFRFWDHVQG